MKKRPNRLLTDAAREIRKTMSRFLSLFLLSALAVAFLAGLRTTAPDMERTADLYYDAHALMDLRVLSTLGLTDGDIAALAAQDGVEAAEGAYSVDALIHLEENDLIVKLHSLSEQGINAPALLTGRLPENDREILVDSLLVEKAGLSLGDTLRFDTGDGRFADALAYGAYTVVGTVDSPLYISFERGTASVGSGKAAAFALLPMGAFQLEYYTDAYLRAAGASSLLCYGEEYADLIAGLKDRLEPLSGQRAALRYGDIIGEAEAALAEAQLVFDDAEADANRTLEDAKAELSGARAELDRGWVEWENGKAALARETAAARQQIEDAKAALSDALQALEEGEAEYDDGLLTLADGRAQYEQGLSDWYGGEQAYLDGYAALREGEAEYAASLDTLTASQAEYDDGYAAYEAALVALEDGGGQLMAAERQLKEANLQLRDGRDLLATGRVQLEQGQQVLSLADGAYSAANEALGGILSAIDPNLTPDSPDEEIAGVVNDYLDQTISPGDLDGPIEDLQAWLGSLPEELRDYIPPEVTEGLDGLTGQDALDALKGNLLDTVSAAREAGAEAGRQLEGLRSQVYAGESQYRSGAAQVAEAQSQYRDGLRLYQENLALFQDSVVQVQEAGAQLEDAKAALEDGWRQLYEGRKELDDGWAELGEARTALEDGWDGLEDARRALEAGEAEASSARARLDEGRAEYQDGLLSLEEAQERLPRETADAQRKLDDAHQSLLAGEAEYADGLASYEDGRETADEALSSARRQLNDAKRAIRDIAHCTWYVLDRNTNVGYVSYQQDAERMGNLSAVFPLIFFLVAALVCLTTMTRMVEEQRVEIGGMKALGYGKWAISIKYVGYGLLASLSGGLAGLALGCTLIPLIIFNAWKIMYSVGELSIPFYPGVSLISVSAAVICVTGTAFAACFATLAAGPAALMRPRAPKPGKRVLLERVTPVWRRMSFTWKVTVRNLLRYKKRFCMTVVGIGGCTALIVTGFGLRDSIYDILDLQFDEISTYDSQISLADDLTDDEMTEIARALDTSPLVDAWTASSLSSVSVEGEKRAVDAYLFAVEDEEIFSGFIHLRHRQDGAPVSLPSEGVVLTEKLAELLGVAPGDTITLDAEGRVTVPVVELTENYVYHYVYLSSAYYQSLFGAAPNRNLVMARYTENRKEAADQVSSSLIALSGVNSVNRIQDSRASFSRSMESVDYAVILIIICAAALAFVVLYNLTNINITERLRELATLKVLGFYQNELSAYVYRENIFLTLFGILFGLVMGKQLHQWLVLTVEVEMVMFGRSARPSSYLFAVGLTVLFSLLVNLAARRRLNKIDMVESLKTVE